VGGAILWLQSDWYLQLQQERAGNLAGMQFSIERVEQPRRGQMRWHKVALYDYATGQLLAKAAKIDFHEVPRGLQLRATDAWLDEAIGQSARSSVLQCLSQSAASSGVWLSTPCLLWHCDDREFRLNDVQAGIEPGSDANQAYFAFRPTESTDRGPWIRLINSHKSHRIEQIECQTYQYSLPCRWFAAFGIDLSGLGPAAEFGGHLTSTWVDDAWHTQAMGRLNNIDLARLMPPGSPHRLTGMAQLQTELTVPLRLRGNRLERLSATITAGPGEISASLLDSAAQHLEMRYVRNQQRGLESGNYAYRQLLLRVLLEPQGVIIQGRCDANGAVMNDSAGAFVSQPPRVKTIADLVAALSPPSSSMIPATADAQRLAGFLPAAPPSAGEPGRRFGARNPTGQATK
jgi:hypothetical protein